MLAGTPDFRACASGCCSAVAGSDGAVLEGAAALREGWFEGSAVNPILLLPALGSIWLGLNVVRYYSHDPESPESLYSTVVRIQDVLVSCGFVVGLIAMQWLIAEIAMVVGRRISRGLVGRRKTWWNRPLKGTWLWGSVVGYAISLLIVSSFLRWALLFVAILGILFAAMFRALRSDDEI
jgi:hypothetical protein